jgi:hypothetical protein
VREVNSYITSADADDYRVRRMGAITFTTQDAGRYIDALGGTITYALSVEYSVKCYVVEVFVGRDGQARVTLQPTGAPIKNAPRHTHPGLVRYIQDVGLKQMADTLRSQQAFIKLLDRDYANEQLKRGDRITFGKDANFTIIDDPMKEKKLMKVRNRFYVAAPSVTSASEQDQVNSNPAMLAVSPNDRCRSWTRSTLKDAVEHARKVLEQDPSKDHVAIVQIVRVVRRQKAPVVVEVVK